jgi:hypothetical protein
MQGWLGRNESVVWGWLLLAMIGGGSGSSIAAEAPKWNTTTSKLHWRDPLACGQTSAYVFLKLSGLPVTLPAVRDAIPVVPDRGSNLAEIAEGCRRLGLEVDVVRSTPSEFDRAPLPVLAHMTYPVTISRKNVPVSEVVGHFLVVVGTNDREIDVIDASSVDTPSPRFSINRGAFFRQWSGALLIRRGNPAGAWGSALGWEIAGLLAAAAVVTCWSVVRCRVGHGAVDRRTECPQASA